MSPLTKMLVVLQLVFSVILSTLLVLMISRQQNYKSEADSANAGRLTAQAMLVSAQNTAATLQGQLSEMQKSVGTVSNQLTQARTDAINSQAKSEADLQAAKAELARLTQQVSTLTTNLATATQTNAALNAELADLRPKVTDLTQKYAELYRAKNESDNQLRASDQAIRKLQEQLEAALNSARTPATTGGTGGGAAAMMGTEGQVQVLSNGMSAQGPVNAKIGKIGESAGRTLIELPLGTRDGIQAGSKLFVYRGTSFVADAVIQRVWPDQSVAAITNLKPGETVKEGDMVSTVSK